MDRDTENIAAIKLSNEAKKQYLVGLIGKMLKILHLIEEEKNTGFSPDLFIEGQLFELNSANELFNGALVNVIIKLNGIKEKYQTMSFEAVKKQIFEIKRIINYQIKKIEELS